MELRGLERAHRLYFKVCVCRGVFRELPPSKHNNSDSCALASSRLRTPTAARHAGTDQRAIHHKGGVAGSDRREEGFAKETEG